MSAHILLVEDDPLQRMMVAALLTKKLGHRVTETDNGRGALLHLQNDTARDIQLAIIDLYMPDMNGMELLEIVSEHYPQLPVIMLTGAKEIDIAVRAMQLGASDFLNKPPDLERLRVSIQHALKISLLEKEVQRLKSREEGHFSFFHLTGHDGCLARQVAVGRKAAASAIPVLLTGETGVGKEVFARAVHGESSRTGKPFVAVNCGAIPSQLVESTLFGHEKGAFTGAIARSAGRFQEADGGTIFLDEIGDLPLDAQVKLLRVLQQKEVMPVGGKAPVPVNVRVISATHRDLEQEVAAGRFREDLYFRINVLQIHLPPLRERKEDIPLLARHFIERFAARDSLPFKDISSDAAEYLMQREWKGNVRELENVIHRALVLSENDTLKPEDFRGIGASTGGQGTEGIPLALQDAGAVFSFLRGDGTLYTADELQQAAIEFSLKHFRNNITQAAQALGIAKSTFYRKIKES